MTRKLVVKARTDGEEPNLDRHDMRTRTACNWLEPVDRDEQVWVIF